MQVVVRLKMIIKIKSDEMILNKKIQDFCKLPYPQHPKGCPNYNKKAGCPPNQKLINKFIDFKQNLYLIYTEFDVGNFAKKMGEKHPKWSERQKYCCLYWQGKAKKEHNNYLEEIIGKYKMRIIKAPEKYGVNINSMMIKLGIKLEWPPRKISRVISLGGFRK